MTSRIIVVITAGLSQPSSTRLLGEQLAAATSRSLTQPGSQLISQPGTDAEIVYLELRDLAHDVVNNLLTGFPSPTLATAIGQVTSADAVIAVTPIFSASYSGLFKSFFDVLDPEALAGKPVLIAATGGSARHSLTLEYALRPLFSYLRADITATAVYAATADWGSAEAGSALSDRIDRAGGQLADLITRSTPSAPADPFGQPSSFLSLLGKN